MIYKIFYPQDIKIIWSKMAIDDETRKLLRLRRVAQEYDARRKTLQAIWSKMQNFAQGLRNELDGQYWSESKIAFDDLERVPEFNQYKFTFGELKQLFDITFIKDALDNFRKLFEEKTTLEEELGVSMDRRP